MKPLKLLCLVLPLMFIAAGFKSQPEKINEFSKSLLQAAADGNIAQVKSLLSKGAEINARDERGLTPLHHAASRGHNDIVDLLISKGADTNSKDKWGYTPLYYAIWYENKDIVKLLITKGADVNLKPEKGYPPLHYAVWNEDIDTVKLLVANGAKFDMKDQDGWTAFCYAAAQGNRDIVEFFIAKGADVSSFHMAACTGDLARVKLFVEQGANVDTKDELGWTPLYWAASTGQENVAEFLIANGADVNAKTNDNSTPLYQAAATGGLNFVQLLIAKGADVNGKDKHGNTPLHSAALSGQREVVELLISKGAIVDLKGRNGRTPLHNAARQGHKGVVELFVAHGADINAKDNRGRTPLWWANRRGHKEIVELLMAKGATISLHTAVSSGDLDMLRRLIAKGANVNAKDKDGRTPLHHAAEQNRDEFARILVTKGAGIDVQDNFALTPLHLAAVKGHKNIVEFLLEKGAEIDSRDSAGRTPLHYASGAGGRYGGTDWGKGVDIDTATLLLNKCADINAKDKCGWTPLHYAVRMAKKAIVELLVNRGADLNVTNERGRTAFSLARGAIADILRKDKAVYYVATNGNDSNLGTLKSPFKTLNATIDLAEPGDTIFVRGGVYPCSGTINIDKSGEEGKPIHLRAYPTETPIFDFSTSMGNGFLIRGAYWHLKGLIVTNAESNGVHIDTDKAHHNVIEQVKAGSNGNTGINLSTGAAHNLILNCDSYRNIDPETNGENADGFGVKFSVGAGNVFIGCRGWNNSDDGFDFWYAGSSVRVENCYAYRNGENIWGHPCFTGNANGFKLGQMEGAHLLIRCVAWDHPMRGFDLNGNSTGVTLYNCTAFRNNINFAFMFSKGNIEKNVLMSNLSYKGLIQIRPQVDDQFNSWNTPPGSEIMQDDFLGLDDSVITEQRNPDGRVPHNNFLKLAPTSDVIDKGVDIGMPFVGEKPDLGSFEYDPNEDTRNYVRMLHQYVRDHDMEKINETLSTGVDINEKDWLGYAPLHWACYFGYADLVTLLMDKGADPNLISNTGRTCLEIATEMDYGELVELLLQSESKTNEQDELGRTLRGQAASKLDGEEEIDFTQDAHLPRLDVERGKYGTYLTIRSESIPGLLLDVWCYEDRLGDATRYEKQGSTLILIHKLEEATVTTRFEPIQAGVDIQVHVTGPTAEAVQNVRALNPCCQFGRSTAFRSEGDYVDDFVARCFVFLDTGLTLLKDTKRIPGTLQGKDDRANYPKPWIQEYFPTWRKHPGQIKGERGYSPDRPVYPIIGVVSRDRKYLAAIAWPETSSLGQVWHHCIHPRPLIAESFDAKTGEIRSCGKIYLMENDGEKLLRRFKEDFPHWRRPPDVR